MNTQIRHIETDDVSDISELHHDAVHRIFGNDYDKDVLDILTSEYYGEQWQNRLDSLQNPAYVAIEQDKVCGFVLFGGYRDKDASPEEGEIYSLYIDSEHKPESLMLNLLETALSHLSFSGYQRFYIWVPEKDTTLTKLLEGYQFEHDGRTRIEKQDGLVLTSKHYVKTLYNYADDEDDILRL